MIFQLSLQEHFHVHHVVALCILDVLHTAEYVVVGFFILDLLGAQLFLNTEVLFLCFLYLGKRGVVSQSPAVQLLASVLRHISPWSPMREENRTYLVVLHLGKGPLQRFKPA